jgi:hypothetical protein
MDHHLASSTASAEAPTSAPDAASIGAPAQPGTLQSVWNWIVEHDDSKLFIVLYIGLAVVLSIWISLFWLVAVVAVHGAFELVRQSHHHRGGGRIALEAAWELKLDVALVLLALVLALYMEMVLGVVGLQGAARLGAASRAAPRIAGWERTLRGLLLSVDDAAQVARAASVRNRAREVGEAAVIATAVESPSGASRSRWGSWGAPYGIGAWISLGLGVIGGVLILVAPWFTPHTAASAIATLAAELRPFP